MRASNAFEASNYGTQTIKMGLNHFMNFCESIGGKTIRNCTVLQPLKWGLKLSMHSDCRYLELDLDWFIFYRMWNIIRNEI